MDFYWKTVEKGNGRVMYMLCQEGTHLCIADIEERFVPMKGHQWYSRVRMRLPLAQQWAMQPWRDFNNLKYAKAATSQQVRLIATEAALVQ